MTRSNRFFSAFSRSRTVIAAIAFLIALAWTSIATAQTTAYIRINQVGYETAAAPFKAYLMTTATASTATFNVVNSENVTVATGTVGALIGNWADYCVQATGQLAVNGGVNNNCPAPVGSAKDYPIIYSVYPIVFTVSGGDTYTINVSGPVTATSPQFAVNTPDVLYPGLLLNTLFFYETQRDGPDYIQNALRTAPGHLNDVNTYVYLTPPIDKNDYITYEPPANPPLISAGIPNMDTTGGWWDAGDYEIYVETISYTAALMQIGIRDFPNQMGPNAPLNPPAPPVSVSYAGTSGTGAPASSDFTAEAKYGVQWLMKMWNDKTKTLVYQVDNTQDWDYYGEGTPGSTACGGTFTSLYCLLTEYDIWVLPQAGDNYQQPGDPEPCDPYTSYYICYRPAFEAATAGSLISPNLTGRMTADFAEYYQLYHTTDPATANQALIYAEDIFALANPSPSKLLTIMPFDGYGESVWHDDMELGATELYFALQSAGGAANLPAGLQQTSPSYYLQQAATHASSYLTGSKSSLNLYDVAGLAHYELYRALAMAGSPTNLAVTQTTLLNALTTQVGTAITAAGTDVWGFGRSWSAGDTTSFGAGLSVMASEVYNLTGTNSYQTWSQQWLGNILGANSWGVSFIVGDGTTFPNCIQHQVANLAGSLNGSGGGTPVLWGAATEGPDSAASNGYVDGMNVCPINNIDTYAIFNGRDSATASKTQAVFQDDMQSYSTTEPGIDLTSTSFLMFSWRMAGSPSNWTSSVLAANPAALIPTATTTLTATVTSTGSAAPTGNVTFYSGSTSGTQLGQAQLTAGTSSSSTASVQVQASALALGSNNIVAYFGGDAQNDGPSTSSALAVYVGQPGIYSPGASSILTGTSAIFSWVGYTGATGYWLDAGKEPGGNEYYQSGSLPSTTLSATVNSLPLDGSTVYVTWYYYLNGVWVSTGYSYTAAGGGASQGAMVSPAPNSTLSGSNVTFTWSAGSAATAYWLDAGTAAGGNQYYQSGNLGDVLTTTVNTLPTNGSVVYVTLYSLVSGQWLSNVYTYNAFSLTAQSGVLTTPIPGSILTGSSATFSWTAGAGASDYWLDVGSTAGGNQYSQSGNLDNVLSTTVSGLPTDGGTIYVTLYSMVGNAWSSNAYTYTAANLTSGLAVMQTPTPGGAITGNQATFTWSADTNASAYWVDISAVAAGGNDVYQSGNLGNVLTTTVNTLPANGSTLYVTLYTYVGGQWLSNAYTYSNP